MTSCNLLLSLLTLAAPLPRQAMDVPQGSWVVVSAEHDPDLGKVPERMVFKFDADRVSMFTTEGKQLSTFELKTFPSKKPKEMELTADLQGKKYILHAIYQLEKDRLVICLACATGDQPVNESERPTEFKGGKNRELLTLERSKK